jgi:murein DD-endopeptidase MepM/ murein hydrolase activator NlpD
LLPQSGRHCAACIAWGARRISPAYGHLAVFATGLSEGVRVRQGQIIGFVGSSGFSSGPHLHYEVLIKNSHDAGYRHIDPLSVDAPQERELAGKVLADFERERDRIDKLMRRDPISTRIALGTLRP